MKAPGRPRVRTLLVLIALAALGLKGWSDRGLYLEWKDQKKRWYFHTLFAAWHEHDAALAMKYGGSREESYASDREDAQVRSAFRTGAIRSLVPSHRDQFRDWEDEARWHRAEAKKEEEQADYRDERCKGLEHRMIFGRFAAWWRSEAIFRELDAAQ